MADPRFHRKSGPIKLGQLSAQTGLFAVPDGVDPAMEIADVAPLETAGPADFSFLDNRKYLPALKASKAGCVAIAPELVERAPESVIPLATPHPYLAFALVAQAFYPLPPVTAGVHPAASVHPDARVAESAEISANAVIDAGAEIGAGCLIGANVSIGRNVILGKDCRIEANVSLDVCILGDRVYVQAGARIGAAGFGFAPHPERHQSVPQVGRVMIGDDCHIGANACIARGSGHDTVLERNVRIDNLVQVAHNCRIGEGSMLAGLVGLAGSSKLGRFVQMGGQSGAAGHMMIGDGARIAATSGAIGDVEAGAVLAGLPAIPAKQFWRQLAALKRLASKRDSGE